MEKIVYDLDFDELQENEGVFALALVETPAIESNFIMLSDESCEVRLSAVDDSKRILMGPVLIPNKEIQRKNGTYIRFSEDTVRKSMEAFMIRGHQSQSNIEHSENKLSDVCVVENWIVDDPNMDKSKANNIDVPKGTWMASQKVDEATYQLAKEGKIKGFSIEGLFPDRVKVEMSKEDVVIEGMSEDTLKNLEMLCKVAIEDAGSKEEAREAIEFIKNALRDG